MRKERKWARRRCALMMDGVRWGLSRCGGWPALTWKDPSSHLADTEHMPPPYPIAFSSAAASLSCPKFMKTE